LARTQRILGISPPPAHIYPSRTRYGRTALTVVRSSGNRLLSAPGITGALSLCWDSLPHSSARVGAAQVQEVFVDGEPLNVALLVADFFRLGLECPRNRYHFALADVRNPDCSGQNKRWVRLVAFTSGNPVSRWEIAIAQSGPVLLILGLALQVAAFVLTAH